MIGLVAAWEVIPPAGLTDTGRIHRFQERTVARLQGVANSYADRTLTRLQSAVNAHYQEGEGTVYQSLRVNVARTQTGVGVSFEAGGRHLQYLTAMAGLPFQSPGHMIPNSGMSRFHWRNPLYGLPPGIYTFSPQKQAFWRPRRKGDPIADVLAAGAAEFQRAMIAEHDRALVEFIQNDLALPTRSPRVNVRAAEGTLYSVE